MATATLEAPMVLTRRKLDVDEYHRMGEAGILDEDDRVELIEGELIEMAPIGSDHSGAVNALNRTFVLAVGTRALVAPQNPLRLDRSSEPQPDLLLLRPRADDYRASHPAPTDVLLLVEVANGSGRYDRGVKLPLYARHGVPEVWILDVVARTIEIHRKPSPDGYRETLRPARDAVLTPMLLQDLQIAVADILR